MMQNALPSPEYTGDSDSDTDIALELNQKRRQLDEEIARFRAVKDREFREFEIDLKSRRQYRKGSISKTSYHGGSRPSPSTTPPTTSLLTGYTKKIQSPHRSPAMKHSEPMRLIKPNTGPKATTPTIALDKLTIRGENIPPSQKSPIHSAVPRNASGGYLLPSEVDKHDFATSGLKIDRNDAFARFPTSKYLPVLDPRVCSPGEEVEGTQTEPASPAEPSFIIESVAVHSSSMPTASSIPEPFQVPSTKRAYTSPSSINRRTLPPIIRNHNGRKRTASKRKRVTFQLADRAIVQPSSSYEEGPSPDSEEIDERRTSSASTTSLDSVKSNDSDERPVFRRQKTPIDPFGRRQRTITPIDTPDEEVGMSMADLLLGTIDPSADGYFSPRHSISQETPLIEPPTETNSPIESPTRNSKSPEKTQMFSVCKTPKSPHFSPHHSPLTRPLAQHYPGMIEDELLAGPNNVGFFELDEELGSPKLGPPELAEDDGIEEVPDQRRRGLEDEDVQTGTSVPINIIRPSSSITSSWVGTFGH